MPGGPLAEEQDYIHDKYVNELIPGKYVPETRDRMLAIAARMREKDGIHALILGGTELPLLLTDSALVGIPFLDTTQIHVDAVLKAALGYRRAFARADWSTTPKDVGMSLNWVKAEPPRTSLS